MAAGTAEPKAPKVNRLGLEQGEYRASPSTLCAGCGHDAITAQIIKAMWEMGVEPWNVAKMSGIGCSSKSTAYFLGQSHGFNGVHGRMAAQATGSHLANRRLVHIGVSGDGDTASIGLGNFLHMVRRNVPLIYIIENNGVYGLTKGQFSATADQGSKSKHGAQNQMEPIDCCALAIQMGCQYVARSFSGDVKQLVALLKGAIAHRGTALLDVVSPCVTFNNHEGSTKSLQYARQHEEALHEIGFVPYFEPLTAEPEPGTTTTLDLPDGSKITLKKLAREYDPTDRMGALKLLDEAQRERLFLTGLLYRGAGMAPLGEQLNLVEEPLATLPAERLRPPAEALEGVMARLR
jgi:2-oxoglutarate ferredoxin oxidoreductase subunit beta